MLAPPDSSAGQEPNQSRPYPGVAPGHVRAPLGWVGLVSHRHDRQKGVAVSSSTNDRSHPTSASQAGTGPAGPSAMEDVNELQHEIERTREHLGQTVEHLAAKADVKA